MVHQIKIQMVANGFSVQAGCQFFVFTTPKDLSDAVLEWASNPVDTEKRYLREARNIKWTFGDAPRPVDPAPSITRAPVYPTDGSPLTGIGEAYPAPRPATPC